jgi:hypothetical protein
MIGHKMCLESPGGVSYGDASYMGFPIEGPLADYRWPEHHEWRIGMGRCECDCDVCKEVKEGKCFYVYRYTPAGREVIKITPILDGSEGVA